MATMRVAQISKPDAAFEIVERPFPSRAPGRFASKCRPVVFVIVIRS